MFALRVYVLNSMCFRNHIFPHQFHTFSKINTRRAYTINNINIYYMQLSSCCYPFWICCYDLDLLEKAQNSCGILRIFLETMATFRFWINLLANKEYGLRGDREVGDRISHLKAWGTSSIEAAAQELCAPTWPLLLTFYQHTIAYS